MKRKLMVTVTKIHRETVYTPAHLLRRCPACEREVETLSPFGFWYTHGIRRRLANSQTRPLPHLYQKGC